MELLAEASTGDEAPIPLYGALSIKDLLEHEEEILSRAKKPDEQPRSGFIGFLSRYFDWSYKNTQLVLRLLSIVDEDAELRGCEPAFIYIPGVRHIKEQDLYPSQTKSMTLYDILQTEDTLHIETYRPPSYLRKSLREEGWGADFAVLKGSDWGSPVLLLANFTAVRMVRYNLLKIFNQNAADKQEKTLASFLEQLGFQGV